MSRASRVMFAIGFSLAACAPQGDAERATAPGSAPAVVEPGDGQAGAAGSGAGGQGAPADVGQRPDGAEPPPVGSSDGARTERCSPAPGTTGSPATISELMALLDGLPKPTTLPCLLESLERPLELYLTSSVFSAQPAPAERSPRTFVVLGPLRLSVVAEGEASHLLELGYQSAPGRSIKAEIPFPLEETPTPSELLDQVRTGRVSMCGGCHTNERQVPDEFFDGAEGAFESDVIPPLYVFEVGVEALRAEAESCDAQLEPERCGMLSALFDHGEVLQSTIWSERP